MSTYGYLSYPTHALEGQSHWWEHEVHNGMVVSNKLLWALTILISTYRWWYMARKGACWKHQGELSKISKK